VPPDRPEPQDAAPELQGALSSNVSQFRKREAVTERKRLKVVTLVDGFSGLGGGERVAAEFAMRLDPGRFESVFCVSRPFWGPGREESLRAAGVRTLTLRRHSARNLLAWRPLISLLRRECIDILHCHKFGSNLWGTVIGRLSGVPVIVAHEHVWSFEGQALRRLLDRHLIAKGAHVFLTVSNETRRQMIEVEGIDPDLVRVLPNGIPTLARRSGREVRRELSISPEALVVGTVSVLRPQKALQVLIRGAARLVSEFPILRVIIAGEGPERANLEALITELGLDGQVMLVGPRTDVSDVLASFDVAVSSSDYEGSPLAVIEYMAAAKAIVATRVGGVPDLIEDGIHGLLVEAQDAEGLASAVARLLREPDLRARLGEEAQKRQQAEFTIDAAVHRLELLYEELSAANAMGGTRRLMHPRTSAEPRTATKPPRASRTVRRPRL
jgi:glycosyltransferase involved in cell wall biosynthesis